MSVYLYVGMENLKVNYNNNLPATTCTGVGACGGARGAFTLRTQ